MERLREHYPDTQNEDDAVKLLMESEPVSRDLTATYTRNAWRRVDEDSEYRILVQPDRVGIFVIAGDRVVTYLRLSQTIVRLLNQSA